MKIAILGAGAMGSVFGATLAQGNNDVTLIDVQRPTVQAINTNGLSVLDKQENEKTILVKASDNASTVGVCDLVIIFVKCYHTEDAARSAMPLLGPETQVLSLQNGWGNGPKIGKIVDSGRVLMGVTYHSATVRGPGQIHHAGQGKTWIGEMEPRDPTRVRRIAEACEQAGIETAVVDDIRTTVWAKLALNACTLPTSALLQFYAGELLQHRGTMELMEALLKEVIAVAHAQNIAMNYDERWKAITGLLERAQTARSSMLQDMQAKRRTEIDVINGAIVQGGKLFNIPTPYNNAMVWMVKAIEETFQPSGSQNR
jgi:2-dehydropantoate 2-reductase